MKKFLTLLVILFAISIFGFSQKIKAGFLVFEDNNIDKEEAAAWNFLIQAKNIDAKKINLKKSFNAKTIEGFEVLWLHYSDTVQNIETRLSKKQLSVLKSFVENSGGLLLTREAFQLIAALGLETSKPDFERKKAEDSGYGRMLGFHSYRSHPVFNGLNGGAYVLKPSRDITVRNYGFFGEHIPEKGKVVATDWDYIFLREDKKMILEYESGNGKVLAVGSYMYFEFPTKQNALINQTYNVNRLHLEKFSENCLNYLAGKKNEEKKYYWNYKPFAVIKFNSDSLRWLPVIKPTVPSHRWSEVKSRMLLKSENGGENFWDVAGERMLVMGKEKGGIDEIWAHPFMAFRDIESGIKLSETDTIWWLKNQTPHIEVRPESFTRIYFLENAVLKEIITTSPDRPQAVVHYEFTGNNNADVFVRFKTNQRIMWPYSEIVTGGINFDFHKKLNAYIFSDPSGDFVSLIGFNKPLAPVSIATSPLLPSIQNLEHPVGNYNLIYPVNDVWQVKPGNESEAAGLARILLESNDCFDVVISATSEGTTKAVSEYDYVRNNPEKIFNDATKYHENLQNQSLNIITPDSVFNEGYAWAIEGADRFFTTTPGIGSSLVAGIGTTEKGWDGGHKVNGRPGYAWYFGRDSEWSCFALLHYGDFEKVKANLELLQNFQDLNGKIFHELSTSGFVHYDASDATPFYVVLAGRYLKHSGDVDFIKQSWPHVKAAMDFMYSTDTDNDGLIENTNVGHGWVEGGGLFGSHTSLYLASCWCEALKSASFMAGTIGNNDLAEIYAADANKVQDIINTTFLNEDEGFYYHGLKADGSFIEEQSIMPAIPALFGQISQQTLPTVIERFAANENSSDWGVRIVGESSPLFKPNGYHTGSVWPLFTGWTSLAEYQAGRSAQGFSHLMNNLIIYQHWALGFLEEVLNGAEYKPSGVCHHQCWSQTMVLQPAIEGMLGFEPDATNNSLSFSPAFPANWDSLTVQNLRIGESLFDFRFKRDNDDIRYDFHLKKGEPLNISFYPKLPKDCQVLSITMNGETVKLPEDDLILNFSLSKEVTFNIQIKNGTEILPVITHPEPGKKSGGFRIISAEMINNCYEIVVEGKPGTHEEFEIYINDRKPTIIENAGLKTFNGDIYKISTVFPDTDKKYARQYVKLFFD